MTRFLLFHQTQDTTLDTASNHKLMRLRLRVFGLVLLLGGVGHCLGVGRLYLTSGVPDAKAQSVARSRYSFELNSSVYCLSAISIA